MAATQPREGSAANAVGDAGALAAFYEATCRAAFGLAFRITGDMEMANAACEAAYRDTWALATSEPSELELLGRVREQSLRVRRDRQLPGSRSDAAVPTYMEATAVRAGLAGLQPLPRRTLELAFYGGLGVEEIAEFVGEPAQTVRSVLRTALLELGTRSRAGQETRT